MVAVVAQQELPAMMPWAALAAVLHMLITWPLQRGKRSLWKSVRGALAGQLRPAFPMAATAAHLAFGAVQHTLPVRAAAKAVLRAPRLLFHPLSALEVSQLLAQADQAEALTPHHLVSAVKLLAAVRAGTQATEVTQV